ncbi:hypothetical protein TI04_04705 [Achromatium sp. WMS2]|nr:hypothetical protein TI04_04705 [Achromatium sp. WMS2]
MNTRPSIFELGITSRETWIEDRIPDPSLFLPWPTQDQLIKTIKDSIENTTDPVLIIGPQGIGKTTLVYRLQAVAHSQDQWLLCRIDANPMLHQDQLFQRLARRVGLNSEVINDTDDALERPGYDGSKYSTFSTAEPNGTNLPIPLGEQSLADNLHHEFSKLRLQGRLPVVIVDDAEQLPPKTLKSLLELHKRTVEDLSPFALILLAEPAIDFVISNVQLDTKLELNFHRIVAPTLQIEQISEYLAHMCRLEGSKKPRLIQSQLDNLYAESNGIPGQINNLFKSLLREDVTYAQQNTNSGKTWLFYTVSGLIITTIAYATLIALKFPVPYSEPIITTVNQWLSKDTTEDNNDNSTNGWVTQTLPLPDLKIKPLDPTKVGNNQQPAFNPNHSDNHTGINQNQPSITDNPGVNSTTHDKTTSNTNTTEVKDNNWVLKQDDSAYTIQLIAATNADGAQRYINQNDISDQAFYIEVPRSNGRVYFVMYGTYPTRTEANAAIGKLPLSLRKRKPYPRSFSKIKPEIQGHN